jgi:mono/diheme cytochrome c family protein
MKTLKLTAAFLVAFGFLGMTLLQFANADEAKTGKTIFEEAKCTACHGIESQGIEAKKKSDKNPDLSVFKDAKDAAFYTLYLKKEEVLNSKKHPVPFKGSDEDLKIMVDWLIDIQPK